jgi:hypothetical protein
MGVFDALRSGDLATPFPTHKDTAGDHCEVVSEGAQGEEGEDSATLTREEAERLVQDPGEQGLSDSELQELLHGATRPPWFTPD